MTRKQIVLLPLAERDIDAIQHYQQEGGPALAVRWADAVEYSRAGACP